MQYADSRREFEVRVVAVMLMSHFLNDDYIDRVIEVLNHLYTGELPEKNDFYYAKMGVAWAIATIAAKYPEKCLKYMKSKEKDLTKLVRYADMLSVRDEVMKYVEVLV